MKKKTAGQASGASPSQKHNDYVPKQTKNLRGQAATAAAVAAAAAAAINNDSASYEEEESTDNDAPTTPPPAKKFRGKSGAATTKTGTGKLVVDETPKSGSKSKEKSTKQAKVSAGTKDVGKEKEEEDDIEEISHVTGVGKKSPMANFKIAEDVWIARAFINASEDAVTGVGQKSQAFWNKISEVYHLLKRKDPEGSKYVKREVASLQNRWKRHIRPDCTLWLSIAKRLEHNKRSGWNHTKYMEECRKLFIQQTNGKDFRFTECIPYLKDSPKFATYVSFDETMVHAFCYLFPDTFFSIILKLAQQKMLDSSPTNVVKVEKQPASMHDPPALHLDRPVGNKKAKQFQKLIESHTMVSEYEPSDAGSFLDSSKVDDIAQSMRKIANNMHSKQSDDLVIKQFALKLQEQKNYMTLAQMNEKIGNKEMYMHYLNLAMQVKIPSEFTVEDVPPDIGVDKNDNNEHDADEDSYEFVPESVMDDHDEKDKNINDVVNHEKTNLDDNDDKDNNNKDVVNPEATNLQQLDDQQNKLGDGVDVIDPEETQLEQLDDRKYYVGDGVDVNLEATEVEDDDIQKFNEEFDTQKFMARLEATVPGNKKPMTTRKTTKKK